MKCPCCAAHDSKVKKTERPIDEQGFAFGELKRRQRQCEGCKRKFFTFEIHEEAFRNMLVLLEGKPPPRRGLRTESITLRKTHL
jgi:transcriptional regulator NrdR family protein